MKCWYGTSSRLFGCREKDFAPSCHAGFHLLRGDSQHRTLRGEKMNLGNAKLGAFLKDPLKLFCAAQRLHQPDLDRARRGGNEELNIGQVYLTRINIHTRNGTLPHLAAAVN